MYVKVEALVLCIAGCYHSVWHVGATAYYQIGDMVYATVEGQCLAA